MSDQEISRYHARLAPESGSRLMLPLLLEESGQGVLIQRFLTISAIALAAGILWGSIAQIKELARASGQIVPASSIKVVQHLEGGIISEIMVADGQVVEKDGALVHLQPIAAEGDLGQLEARKAALSARVERLSALIEGREMKFGATDAQLSVSEREHLDSNREQRDRRAEGLAARVEQRKADITSLQHQKDSLERQTKLIGEEVALREKLLKKGLVSRVVYLETRRIFEQTQSDLFAVKGRLAASEEELAAAEAALRELDATLRNDAHEDRAVAAAELAEVDSALLKLTDRVDRLVVRAPIRGIVQGVSGRNVGDVIQPGGALMQIVPIDDELVAEVRVQPSDIAYVRVGEPAKVKITALDPARFGALDGTVERISASTFQDEKGEIYYKAVIALGANSLAAGAEKHEILPGMVVSADIVTGEKSLGRYLLKPVFRSLDQAFVER